MAVTVRRALRVFRLLPLLLPAAALLVSCSVRGAQMTQSSLLERFERRSGLIAFIALDGNVATIDQTGGRLTQLTDDAGSRDGMRRWYASPTWSARGRRLAFARFDQFRDGGVSGAVLTTDTASRNPQVVWEDGGLAPVYLYWSPDGRWISVLSQPTRAQSTGGADAQESMELGLVDAAGRLSYKPLDTGLPLFWAWDPGNRFMLAHVGGVSGGSGGRLTLLDIGAGTQKRNFNVRPTRFQSPAVSPDGQRMLYVDSESGAAQLVLRDIDGAGLDVLKNVAGSAFFSFSRDGRRVAVMESASPQLSADGTLRVLEPRRLERAVELDDPSVLAFFWAPDSRRIAYLIPVQPNGQELVVESVFAADPDQLYVHLRVMDARSGDSWAVATFPITSGSLGGLQFFDQYTRSGSIWSPDGNWLVFSAVARGGFPGIFLGSASGNLKPRFVTRGDLGVWSIR